ncbi:rna-dependent rna polymerase 1 [Hordeum vulgare]|nr:rna-dependent rna polymerase 1 [Hordeum vulgare]
MAASHPDVIGGVPQPVGVVDEESGRHSEIDNWLAPVELEGYGLDAYLTYVKEGGKDLEGVEVLDSEEKVEEMTKLFVDKKVLNITIRKATDPSPRDVNMDHIFLEEQIPISNVGETVVYSVSPQGVLHPSSNSSLPPIIPEETYLNTQHSCNFNKGKNGVEEEEDEDEMDKSSSNFDFSNGDYTGQKMSYKSWSGGEDEAGIGTRHNQREEDDTAEHYFGGNSEPSEFWEEEQILSEHEEPSVVPKEGAIKLKPVRKSDPTSKSHSEP